MVKSPTLSSIPANRNEGFQHFIYAVPIHVYDLEADAIPSRLPTL